MCRILRHNCDVERSFNAVKRFQSGDRGSFIPHSLYDAVYIANSYI